MELGPFRVLVGTRVPRVRCDEHGVHVAAVPWAAPGSRFTKDFARVAAWLVKGGMNKTKVSEMLRIDWVKRGTDLRMLFGATLSTFGICFNRDRMAAIAAARLPAGQLPPSAPLPLAPLPLRAAAPPFPPR